MKLLSHGQLYKQLIYEVKQQTEYQHEFLINDGAMDFYYVLLILMTDVNTLI